MTAQIAELKNLTILDLGENPFKTIPKELFSWLTKYNNGNSDEIANLSRGSTKKREKKKSKHLNIRN